MIIKKIKISAFGPMINTEFEPSDDILIVSGNCENPAEVVFDFIRSALYGFHGEEGDKRRAKYYPKAALLAKKFEERLVFGGELLFEVYGKTLRVTCNFGETPDKDYVELSDYDQARNIRIDQNKTIGEYALKMTEGAFVSGCFADIHEKYERNKEGSYNIGKISSFLGINDGKPTITDIILTLRGKLDKIRSPKDKSGELDKLVVKQLKMKTQMTRLSELDSKIAEIKNNISIIESKKEKLDNELYENEKTYLLANGAKLLVTKDKILNIYNSMLVTMRQLDYQREEIKRLQNEKGFKHVYPGLMISFIGILFIIASVLFGDYEIFSLVLKLISVVVITSGILVSVISFAKYLGRFKVSTNGRLTTVGAEVKRLENELADKNEEFIKLIGEDGIVGLSKQWKKSEAILMNATENERRYAILKSVDELNEILSELKLQIAPLEKELNLQKQSLDNTLSVTGTAYAEAARELKGLDEKIKVLTSTAGAIQIALEVAIESKQEFDNVIIPMIISQATKLYKAISDDMGVFSVGSDYCINGRCSEPEKALLSIKAAVCQAVSNDSEKHILAVSGKMDFDTLKNVLRFSRISQLIIER